MSDLRAHYVQVMADAMARTDGWGTWPTRVPMDRYRRYAEAAYDALTLEFVASALRTSEPGGLAAHLDPNKDDWSTQAAVACFRCGGPHIFFRFMRGTYGG